MKTITCTFKSEGKTIKKTAIISDSLFRLSASKSNEASDLTTYDDFWSIIFDGEDGKLYEIEFKYERLSIAVEVRTLTPIKAITWKNDAIADVQCVMVKIK